MRIAFFSPLPPEPTGIGDYSYELLEELRELVDVTAVVADNRRAAARAPDGVQIVGSSSVDAGDFDANVYQMGNNPKYHRFVFDRALEEPGLLVMHDPSLADYLAELCGGADSSIFRDEVTYDSPDIGPEDDLPLVEVGDGTKNLDRIRVLLARRIVTSNVRTLVNSEAMASEMRRRYVGAEIHAIPLPGKVIGHAGDERAGGAPVPIRFGVFGGINYYKRIRPTVDAFIELRRQYADARMVVAGRADDRLLAADIQRVANRVDLGGALEVKTDLSLDQLEKEMLACDVAISLRWPTAGEMSATLMRCLGAGRPVIVSDVLQFRELDQRYCWRVPVEPPDAEAETLLGFMRVAASDPAWCRRVGEAGRRFVERQANYKAVARRYVGHLEECVPLLPAAGRAHRPRMLRRSAMLGVNVTTLDLGGESLEYARRLSDALGRAGIDAIETQVPKALLPDPATPEWDFEAAMGDLVGDEDQPRFREGIPTDLASRPTDLTEVTRIPFGPYDIDLFVVGEREADEFGYLARRARDRDHAVVAVIAPSWVPPAMEFAPLESAVLEIWVPSGAARDAVSKGLPIPIRALPPLPPSGVVAAPPPEGGICTFVVLLDVRDTFARQNPWASIAAFRRAFSPSERGSRARLVVVACHLDPRREAARRLQRELGQVSGRLVNVERPEEFVPQLESGDVFVSLHRSDGFGTRILDAMAIGRPVIATAFIGVGEYLNSTNGCPVGYAVRVTDTGDYYLDGKVPTNARRGECWAEPAIDQAAHWMRMVEAQPRLRAMLGEHAARSIQELRETEVDVAEWVGDLGRRRQTRRHRKEILQIERRQMFDAFIERFTAESVEVDRRIPISPLDARFL